MLLTKNSCMKREIPSEITVKRLSTSPYYNSTFFLEEKKSIESLGRFIYLPHDSTECADVLITNTHTITEHISKEQIEKCLLMIHPNSGYDNFTPEFINKSHFPIIVGNKIRSHAVANYILSAIHTHFSPIPSHLNWDKSRNWDRRLLNELNLQIIGFGHIGKIVHQSLNSLVKNTKIYDPELQLRELDLSDSDIIVFSCSLNPTSMNMINSKNMNQLKDGSLIINAARGELIDFESLINTLKLNPLIHAVLDVFPEEPMRLEDYSNLPNIKMTSHIAGVFSKLQHSTIEFETEVLKKFLNLNEERFLQEHFASNLKNKIRDHYLI